MALPEVVDAPCCLLISAVCHYKKQANTHTDTYTGGHRSPSFVIVLAHRGGHGSPLFVIGSVHVWTCNLAKKCTAEPRTFCLNPLLLVLVPLLCVWLNPLLEMERLLLRLLIVAVMDPCHLLFRLLIVAVLDRHHVLLRLLWVLVWLLLLLCVCVCVHVHM